VHGQSPRTLREDFSGSGALCRGWISLDPRARAIAIDSDPEPLARLKDHAAIRTVVKDVMKADDKADIVAATNFPVGYWHTRDNLLAYLKHARTCLNRKGVLVCDTYGGADAFIAPRETSAILRAADGLRVKYTFEQVSADAATGRVIDALHFRIPAQRGFKARTIRDAFVYDWRLWSIPELRDAMLEAGFRSVEVYDRLGDALDQDGNAYVRPLTPDDRLDDNYVVYVAGRK
jgi:predicted RNA methylase